MDYCVVFISCLDSHSDGTHSLVSKWYKASFLKIFCDKETNSSISWMAWGWVNVQLIFIFWVNYSFKEVNYYWGSQLEQNAPDWQGLWGFNTFPDATKKTWPRNFDSLCGAVHPALASPEKQPSFSQSNFQYLHKYVWSQTLGMCVCVCVWERKEMACLCLPCFQTTSAQRMFIWHGEEFSWLATL